MLLKRRQSLSTLWTFIFILFISMEPVDSTAQEIARWVSANRHLLPRELRDLFDGASSGGDVGSVILRLLGFKHSATKAALSARIETAERRSGEEEEKRRNGEPERRRVESPMRQRLTATTVAKQSVCPFDSEPFVSTGDYLFCKPSHPGDCPSGYVCDQSFVLGRSICCREGFEKPNLTAGRKGKSKTLWKAIAPPKSPTDQIVVGGQSAENQPIVPTLRPVLTAAPTGIFPMLTSVPPTRPLEIAVPQQPQPNQWARLWSTTAAQPLTVNVSILQLGSHRRLQEGEVDSTGAITLVADSQLLTLVDTGSAADTETLLRALAANGVSPDDIDLVVITHENAAHMGNMNFFGQKPILSHVHEMLGRRTMLTELTERPYRRLSPNVEVWKTPGHTQHDLSVLVHNVPTYGTMAIVGDLIPDESFLSEKVDPMADDGVWDAAIKRQNANLMICMADWVVPGHGAPFRVLSQYRQRAGCSFSSTSQ